MSADQMVAAMRRMAEADIEGEYSASRLKPQQLLALVECAEAVLAYENDTDAAFLPQALDEKFAHAGKTLEALCQTL